MLMIKLTKNEIMTMKHAKTYCNNTPFIGDAF